ncbi:MAG: glycosidase [Ignavibacteria bacterium]|nr:glycosidase [Ignavibacteria bacterium]MCU7499202.1 glycosidase [Ignavibacteria bacterium]MCU7520121.1 glycosidase [Ignavibacteria bacterium]MCU7524584.1 glycosidase [Ignavibacteria bacterium]
MERNTRDLHNPKLYEINTRVWIKKFNGQEGKAPLESIPEEVWSNLSEKGMDIVWLMGVWKTCPSLIPRCCFKDFLIRNYDKGLRNWKESDVIGSPYALDDYTISPELGREDALINLRKKLNNMGLKLFLDFIPNHFSADSHLLDTNPEIFLQADEDIFGRDSHTYFKPEGKDRIFAHGRDPFFPAWEDTAQVNYFSPEAVEFMTERLLKIAGLCDGVRCDMAMLPLENVFYNTWRGTLSKMGFQKPARKFWKYAIEKVKEKYPDFIFMAEAYWDLEWELQQLGFDYTYDKKLTDRILSGNVPEIKLHLMAEPDYQAKSVRFIENHDEERSYAVMGKHKAQAAAIIISTIQGMRFYFDGQFEGRRIKLPVQLGREQQERPVECIVDFYDKLLTITKSEIFQEGQWKLLDVLPAWSENDTCRNILAWQWTMGEEKRLVVINFSEFHSQSRIKLDVRGYEDHFEITDLLHDMEYWRSAEEVFHTGLFIDLNPWQSHIFSY